MSIVEFAHAKRGAAWISAAALLAGCSGAPAPGEGPADASSEARLEAFGKAGVRAHAASATAAPAPTSSSVAGVIVRFKDASAFETHALMRGRGPAAAKAAAAAQRAALRSEHGRILAELGKKPSSERRCPSRPPRPTTQPSRTSPSSTVRPPSEPSSPRRSRSPGVQRPPDPTASRSRPRISRAVSRPPRLSCSETATPYICNWKVPAGTNKSYALVAKAYDAANNSGSSSTVTVTSR